MIDSCDWVDRCWAMDSMPLDIHVASVRTLIPNDEAQDIGPHLMGILV